MGKTIEHWDPESETFWQADGKRIARRLQCVDTALAGINTGHHGRAVYHRGTGVYRVMVSKSDAFPRELP